APGSSAAMRWSGAGAETERWKLARQQSQPRAQRWARVVARAGGAAGTAESAARTTAQPRGQKDSRASPSFMPGFAARSAPEAHDDDSTDLRMRTNRKVRHDLRRLREVGARVALNSRAGDDELDLQIAP